MQTMPTLPTIPDSTGVPTGAVIANVVGADALLELLHGVGIISICLVYLHAEVAT